VNLSLPESVADFADSARRAMADAGGVELFRRAEEDPAVRRTVARPLLERLGLDDLEPRGDVESTLASVELSRLAGAVAFPYPVVARLGRPAGGEWDFCALVDERGPWVEHADLGGAWLAVDGEGRGRPPEVVAVTRNRTLVPFAQKVALGPPVLTVGRSDRALVMNLDSARLLGALETAQRLAVEHVSSREQFGRALSAFQAVQFHVADCEVALRGLRQLVRYTAWQWAVEPGTAWPDALALRTFALETAKVVLSTAELLHGATGFCNEHDLTVVTRSVQGPVRIPLDLEATTELLAQAIDEEGFDGLFSAHLATTAGARAS